MYKEFGTPKDIIDSYYSTVNTDDVIKKIRISKYIKLILILLTICLLSLTIMKIYIQYEGHKVFMEEQGFIDLIVRRQEMRSTIIRLLKMHGKGA